MRIAFLSSAQLPSRWAIGVQVTRMCEAFALEGHDVRLYARNGDAPLDTSYDRYGVRRIFELVALSDWLGPIHQLFDRRRLWADIRRQSGIDLFYGRYARWLSYAAVSGKPLVFEAHADSRPGSRRWRRLEGIFARPNFARLVCVTSSLADAYRAAHPALRDKEIMVAPSAAVPHPRAEPAADWPGRPGVLQVGFTGTPFPGKGIELLAIAAARLPDVDFHVVGAERRDLGWIMGEMPGNLRFHGYQPHHRIAGFLRRFDVAVAPYGQAVYNRSGRESAAVTSPSKLAEYFAAGLPVVTSDMPGVRDMLAGRKAALLVPAGDVDAFVVAIERLRDTPDLRATLAATAASVFAETLTASGRARKVLAGIV
jgi:glycosyltransferase involved in cell wall biosynthesis